MEKPRSSLSQDGCTLLRNGNSDGISRLHPLVTLIHVDGSTENLGSEFMNPKRSRRTHKQLSLFLPRFSVEMAPFARSGRWILVGRNFMVTAVMARSIEAIVDTYRFVSVPAPTGGWRASSLEKAVSVEGKTLDDIVRRAEDRLRGQLAPRPGRHWFRMEITFYVKPRAGCADGLHMPWSPVVFRISDVPDGSYRATCEAVQLRSDTLEGIWHEIAEAGVDAVACCVLERDVRL